MIFLYLLIYLKQFYRCLSKNSGNKRT